MGATGLAYGETDTIELSGCRENDNNFLAPIQAESGDEYMLLVNDFSAVETSFQMNIGGTATIDCVTSKSDEQLDPGPLFQVFPSPTEGHITISTKSEITNGEDIQVYNSIGGLVHIISDLNGDTIKLNLSHLKQGVYFLILDNGDFRFQQKIIISR
jgi:hypothetical protein